MRLSPRRRPPGDPAEPRTPLPIVVRVAFVLPMGLLAVFSGLVAILSMLLPWTRPAANDFYGFAKPAIQAMATGQLPP